MQGTFALSYLVQLAIARLVGFFRHWYVDASILFLRRYRGAAYSLEDTVASRAQLHLLFRPLYGDYSFVGRIIGPIFRMGRLGIGLAAHAAIAAGFLAAYLAWAAVPVATLAHAAGLLPL